MILASIWPFPPDLNSSLHHALSAAAVTPTSVIKPTRGSVATTRQAMHASQPPAPENRYLLPMCSSLACWSGTNIERTPRLRKPCLVSSHSRTRGLLVAPRKALITTLHYPDVLLPSLWLQSGRFPNFHIKPWAVSRS